MVYLDHAATAPLSAASERAWLSAISMLRESPGNPSALHAGGRSARRLLEDSRERVAVALGADRGEVVFTSGATESDTLGVLGVARSSVGRSRIVVSGVEHDAVAEQRSLIEAAGLLWDELPVGRDGVSTLPDCAPTEVAVASMSLVSAETGVLQPVGSLVAWAAGRARVHTDAAQAIGAVPVHFGELGVDLLSLGGHKVGAPVGIGALLVRRGVSIATDRPGGGHERKIRSGTVDVAGAAALAAALEEATADVPARAAHYRRLGDRLLAGLPVGVRPTTDAAASPAIVHLSLDTAHPEALLMAMDAAGIMVSAGSACHAGVTRPSEILLKMGRSERESLGVLRVSFGPENTEADVDAFLTALPGALDTARRLDNRGK